MACHTLLAFFPALFTEEKQRGIIAKSMELKGRLPTNLEMALLLSSFVDIGQVVNLSVSFSIMWG